MYKLIKGEFIKLKYSKGFKVLIALSVIFGILEISSTVFPTIFTQGVIIYGYEAFYQQFGDLRALLFVFAGAFSGLFIGEDFSTRSIQSEITSGYSRFSILLSKSIVYMVGICIMVTIQILMATVGATLVNGFGISITAVIMGNMLRAFLMFMFLICACSMICVVTSFYLKNKGTIMAVNMLLLVLIDGIFQLFTRVSNFGMKIYEFTPFVQVLLSTSEALTVADLLKAIAIGIVTILGCFMLAYAVFYRDELK